MSTTSAPALPRAPLRVAAGDSTRGQGSAFALTTCAAAAALGGLGLALLASRYGNLIGLLGDFDTGSAIIAVTFAPVAALVMLRQGPRPIGWILALIGLSHGLVAVATGLATQLFRSGAPTIAAWLAWPTPFIWMTGIALLTVVLPLFFPDGRLLSPRWRTVAGLTALWVALDALQAGFAPGAMKVQGLPQLNNPAGIGGVDPIFAALQLWQPLWLISIVAAMASLVIRFRRAEGRQREQLKWLGLGSGVFVGTFVGFGLINQSGLGPPGLSGAAWFSLAVPILPGAIGIAILRHRLYDIHVVISRGATYGLMTLGVAGAYVLIVGILAAAFGSTGNVLIAVVATGVVAVLFEPARTRVQRVVSRVLFGDRDDPYAALSRLGRRLEQTLVPAEVLPTVVSVVANALRLPYTAIALGDGADVSLVAASGEAVPNPIVVPLAHHGVRIGDLLLGPRPGGEEFSRADRRLLDDFARQVSLAAYAVRSTAELQAARERLVATREEERRRLRRELHDVLGARLAGLNVQVGVLRGVTKTDPSAADRLTLELRGEIQAAIGGVRRILEDLRPSGLDELGGLAGTREIDVAPNATTLRRFNDRAALVESSEGPVSAVQDDRLRGPAVVGVWLVAGAAIAVVASSSLIPLPADTPSIATFLYLAVSATMGCVGAMVATARRHNSLGWVMWIAAVAMAVLWFGWVYAAFSFRAHDGTLPGTVLFAWLANTLFVPAVWLILIVIPLLFPDGRLPSRRWWPIGIVTSIGIALSAAIGAFAAGPLGNLPVDNPLGIGAVASLQPALIGIANVAALVVLPIAAIGSPVVRFRRGDRVARAQLKVFAYAAAVTSIAGAVTVIQFTVDPNGVGISSLVFFLGMAALPISIGIAILRHHLFDIDALISRSAVYGLLTVGVLGIYVAIVGGLGSAFGLTGNISVAVLATGIVAVLFEPARSQAQRAVNRRLFGDRDNPYVALSHLGRRLEETIAPTDILPTVVSAVAEALRLPYVAVELDHGGRSSIVAASGSPSPDPVSVPLVHNGEQVGHLLLGRRKGDDEFGPVDRRLLNDFARQVALASYAVRTAAELELARERLVSARVEERRRLRRELHDDLGTQLAGLNMQMGLLRRVIRRDPVAADRLALDLGSEIRVAIGDVRRILRNLRPTALDQLGLSAALRAIAGRAERLGMKVSVELPDDLGLLPAAVDVAAYRIVQEAFANVARHARASRCTLRVWIDDGLHVVVRDDGIGLSDRSGLGTGIGMISMRERAAEIGGRCVVSNGSEGGTMVSVRLPVLLQ